LGAFLAAAFLLVVPKLLFKAAADEKRRVRAAMNFMVVQVLYLSNDEEWFGS
jgi:hypothetical protein